MQQRINWAELAEQAGIVTRRLPSGATTTNQGSDEARRALEVLIGDDNIQHGVELWLAGRSGEQAGAATAYCVLTYIRSWKGTEVAYTAYRTARDAGDQSLAALAVVFIGNICHPAALQWVDEFLAYPPTANAGVGLVDHALFTGAIYPDDNRLESWLRTAEQSTDAYVLEAVGRVRASMAEWQGA
jgi:hypothetical protein